MIRDSPAHGPLLRYAAQLIIEGLGEAFPAWIEPGSTIQDDLDNAKQNSEG